MSFPHNISLSLTHNEHKLSYQTVAQAIETGDHGYRAEDWVNEEQKLKAIEMDECWTLQWYPDTPVGFYIASGATLDGLLSALRAFDNQEGEGNG